MLFEHLASFCTSLSPQSILLLPSYPHFLYQSSWSHPHLFPWDLASSILLSQAFSVSPLYRLSSLCLQTHSEHLYLKQTGKSNIQCSTFAPLLPRVINLELKKHFEYSQTHIDSLFSLQYTQLGLRMLDLKGILSLTFSFGWPLKIFSYWYEVLISLRSWALLDSQIHYVFKLGYYSQSTNTIFYKLVYNRQCCLIEFLFKWTLFF